MSNIKSKPATKEYKENWDKIFGKKNKKDVNKKVNKANKGD